MKATFNFPLQFINLWMTLLLIWLFASMSLQTDVLVTGVVVTALIALVFAMFSRVYSVVRWTPRIIFNYFLYFGVFLWELIKANLNVMRLVFSPRIDIEPGIVRIETGLKTPMGRLALANSITLTPGTLVIDIENESLYIHWINVGSTDPTEAARAISARFEKYLEVIYG